MDASEVLVPLMANKTEKIPYVYCFLDTNILHHFQTFDEVDWPKVLNAKQVCLVLAPVVLSELDKHKTDYNNARRQNRARKLLPKITKLIEGVTISDKLPQVRRNVTLMVLPNEPFIDWATEHLDPMVNDDRLIASIIEFSRQRPSEYILLISDDSGPRMKAKSRNIRTQAPPDGLKPHIEPPSPEEEENRKLKKQIQELTERMPKLKFGFYEHGQILDEIIRPMNTEWLWQTPQEYAQKKIAQKRKELARLVAKAGKTVQEDEVRKFTEEYEKYFTELEPALKMKFIKNFSPYCKLQLLLINEGSAPAHEVGVIIEFPKGASVLHAPNELDDDVLDDEVEIEFEIPDEPAFPEWAKPPLSELMKNVLPSQSLLSSVSMPSRGVTLPYRPAHKKTYSHFPFERNTSGNNLDKLSHHVPWPMLPMYV
jgi:PIN domain-containing protein